MKDDVKISEDGGVLTARICCEIDHHTARPVRERIDRALAEKKPRLLVLDFTEVGFMDSSGIALILGRVEVAAATGGVVALCGASPTVMRLIRLSGIERVKGLCVLP